MKVNFLRIFFLCCFFLASSMLVLHAQENGVPAAPVANHTDSVSGKKFMYNEDLFAYTDLRYGYSMIGHHLHAGFNFKYRFNLFKLSFTHSDNFNGTDTLRTNMNELGLLYGWSFRKNNFLFNVAFGVSGNWGVATTNKARFDDLGVSVEPIENARSVGFPLEMNVAFTPPPKLKVFSSIGVSFFGNFNSKKSYFGAGLNLSLGKVSPKLPPGAAQDPLREYYAPKQPRQRWID